MPGHYQKKNGSQIRRSLLFFEKIIPPILIMLGVIAVGLIHFATRQHTKSIAVNNNAHSFPWT